LGSFRLVTSPALLDELDEKLRVKFEVASEDADLIRARLERVSLIVKPDLTLTIVKEDPEDNRVLECAVTGKANYVVSGDRHLLKVGSYDGVPIVTVWQFMDALAAEI
jgi:uncharacterized protein